VRLEGLRQLKIGNRTRDLPPCSIVPHPTTLPRGPVMERTYEKAYMHCCAGLAVKNGGDDKSVT
jgi:hypothetical protein